MVLSVQRFSKFYSKIENLHHHHRRREEALPASLQAFRSHISSCITQLLLSLKSEFEIGWLHQCFQLLPVANKAFAKLIADIDYPVADWQAIPMEDYLSFSLQVLDSFNSITGSISHLSHARLSLLHALSNPSSAAGKVKAIAFHAPAKDIEFERKEIKQGETERRCSDKEAAVVEALVELRSVGLWVCRVVLAVLSGDGKVYSKSEMEISNHAMAILDSRVAEMMAKGCCLKEVKELKDLSAAGGGNDGGVMKKLEEFDEKMNEIGKEVDRVFSEVLAARNELLNGIRFRK